MKLLIGADLVPTKRNRELFEKADVHMLLGSELQQLLEQSDYRIFNLEIPLTNQETPLSKAGPALIAPIDVMPGMKAMNVDLFTIGNNHILDQGIQGLRSTMNALRDCGIAYVGAGETLDEASKPICFQLDGKKIGIYACCEHEFSVAAQDKPGANPFDPLESLDHVEALKEDCDYVIVLYHGGKEHYRYPSPDLQKVCRKLVEKGADLVLVQHTHCIGCEERYRNGVIVYGQGNFLFDLSKSEYWQTSLLVQVNDDFTVTYIPVVKEEHCVRLASPEQAQRIMDDFHARSQEILQPGTVEKRYDAFAQQMALEYLTVAGGKESFFFRLLNKLSGNRLRRWKILRRYDAKTLLVLRNYIECEAHREVFLRGLRNKPTI